MDEQRLTALAVASQSGDESSFKELVDRLSRTLLAMAYRYTRDWEWARDLTQESWIRVFGNLWRYDSNRSFSAWLFAIHRNVCRDFVRKPWVRQEVTSIDPAQDESQRVAVEDPVQDLEWTEFRERVLAASERLSQTQREVFLRVDVEQGDQKRVAQALGIRFGTLRTTLHFARKKVAAVLREMEGAT